MYAISIPGKLYHLLYPTSDFTLCGFKSRTLNAPVSSRRAPLHVVTEVSPDRSLCKQCAKMQQRRKVEKSEASRGNAFWQVSKG
jgi:hypothetical protein